MSELQLLQSILVNFHSDFRCSSEMYYDEDSNIVTLHENPEISSTLKQSTYEVEEIQRQLSRDDHKSVFRVWLSPQNEDNANSDSIDAIMKIAAGKKLVQRLENEARLYSTKMTDIQGIHVPKMLGFFKDRTARGLTAVLFLEYCDGYTLDTSFDCTSITLRKAVLATLEAIHDAGVEHGDFRPRNVVITRHEGKLKPIIVGFGRASEHVCNRDRSEELRELYAPQPRFDHYCCNELHDVYLSAQFWSPFQICMDIGISWKLMRDGVEAVVDYMQRRFPEEDVEDIKRQAQRAIWKHILWVKERKAVDFGNESSDEDDDEWEDEDDSEDEDELDDDDEPDKEPDESGSGGLEDDENQCR